MDDHRWLNHCMHDLHLLNHFMDDHHWLNHFMDDLHWLNHLMGDLHFSYIKKLKKKNTKEEMDWGEDRGHKRKSENKGITYLWLFYFS